MAEQLCELKKKGGGGSGLIETVLWENPNPSASFAGQVVTLNDDMDNYRYLKFTFYSGQALGAKSESIISVEEFKKMTNDTSTNNFYRFASPSFRTSQAFIRTMFYRDSVTMSITACYVVNGSGTNNAYILPYQIIGMK